VAGSSELKVLGIRAGGREGKTHFKTLSRGEHGGSRRVHLVSQKEKAAKMKKEIRNRGDWLVGTTER